MILFALFTLCLLEHGWGIEQGKLMCVPIKKLIVFVDPVGYIGHLNL